MIASNYKKILSLGMCIMLCINMVFFSVFKKANAQIPVTDAGAISVITAFYTASQGYYAATTPSQTTTAAQTTNTAIQTTDQSIWQLITTKALEIAEQSVAKIIINEITQATVNWIKGGFNGSPAYVSDPAAFLSNVANQTIGSMISNNPALNFLCQPFQVQIKLALGLSYQPFQNQVTCTLSSALQNIENAGVSVNVSTSQFWTNWLQITTVPQNNPMGAYIISSNQLNSQIASQQKAASQQLAQGQGALSFQQCNVTTYNINGDQQSVSSYTGSPYYTTTSGSGNSTTTSALSANNTWTQTVCNVTTPGAIITNELGVQANSTVTQLNLEASLSNGINAILGALETELVNMAANSLTNLLSNNTASQNIYNSYNSTLNAWNQEEQADESTQLNTFLNATSGTLYIGDTVISGSNPTQVATTTATSSIATSSIPTTITIPTTTSSLGDYLTQQQNTDLTDLQNLNTEELNYQNTYNTAEQILTSAQSIFTTAEGCNYNLGDDTDVLRAQQIDANVITNIAGTPNANRNIASIPWNLTTINNLLAISNNNIAIINAAATAVEDATDSPSVINAMTQVNSTSFDSNPDTSVITDIQTWLQTVGNDYTTASCPIDLSSVLSETIGTSSTAS